MVSDQSNTRRRHRPSSKASRSEREAIYRTEIRSGGSSDTEDECEYEYACGGDNGNGNGKCNQRDRQEQQQQQLNKRRRRRRRQRRNENENEPQFFLLVLQVGAVVMMVCLATFRVHRYLRPSSGRALGIEGLDDVYDVEFVGDGDSENDENPNYRHEQELKLNELLHPSKSKHKGKHKNKKTKKKEETQVQIPPTPTPTQLQNRKMPPLPAFDLSKSSEWDAFGIVDRLENEGKNKNNNDDDDDGQKAFWRAARDLRERFAERYGGENAARMLLDRGLSTFSDTYNDNASDNAKLQVPSDVVATACRFDRARAEKRPFRLAFGGYSVTTGHGNRHQDSYPFQLKEILGPILEVAGFDVVAAEIDGAAESVRSPPIVVTNAAIGGVPSFPYGWCMNEFWGGGGADAKQIEGNGADSTTAIPDVVSWDFGMNEATGGPEGLEAYVRHLISTYSSSAGGKSPIPPKLIVKDLFTAEHRKKLLAGYASILKDPVVLHTETAVEPIMTATKGLSFSENEDDDDEDWRKPPGFQKWREWGAPKGAPGQASHHPAVQEHKLNGWILAMHFVTALEYMIVMESKDSQWSTTTCPVESNPHDSSKPTGSSRFLPAPSSGKIVNNTKMEFEGIFFGHPTKIENNDNNKDTTVGGRNTAVESWTMNPVRCRTTFEPKLSGDLSEIIVNGTIGEDLDPILPKSQYYYNEGWTYDLSEAEKKAKRRLNTYPNGLGFRDSKEAYYGIFESPPMTLLLPYESNGPAIENNPDADASSDATPIVPKIGDIASEWYESIVLCQVNDKNTFDSAFADKNSCNFATDMEIRIGGVIVAQDKTKMFDMIGSTYLGKPICKHVPIPTEARLISHNALEREGQSISKIDTTMMAQSEIDSKLLKIDQVGLLVEVFVSNPHIVHVSQACSLSHVVWEEHTITAVRIHQKPDETQQKSSRDVIVVNRIET